MVLQLVDPGLEGDRVELVDPILSAASASAWS
jgi:hypothetical protein